MKWIETNKALANSYTCIGNDGTGLGFVLDIGWSNNNPILYEAYLDNAKQAVFLGHHKTPRLAQQAVERELLKRWFRYEWRYLGNGIYGIEICGNSLIYAGTEEKDRPAILARAKREFLNEL